MQRLRYNFSNFMIGRYGVDQLGKFLWGFVLALIILGFFIRHPLLEIVTILLIIYLYFRMFSKNIAKRYEENQKFLDSSYKFRRFFNNKKSMLMDLKTHHIYKCPMCKQKIRIPRGRGRVEITCPKCKNKFVRGRKH
ncbi:MAG: hypothetical protein K5931_02495 [Lachnospiraceae bacterium]|nr:hypothetical protein [Lachnospiraceae bacterium]